MSGVPYGKASVPGFQGPYGQPVAMAAPYSVTPVGGADLARSMVRQSVPLELVQQTGFAPDGKSGVVPAQFCAPGGNCPPNLTPPGLPGMPGTPGMPNIGGAGNPFVPGQGARRRRRRRRLDGRRQSVSRAAHRSSFHRPEWDARQLVRPDGGR